MAHVIKRKRFTKVANPRRRKPAAVKAAKRKKVSTVAKRRKKNPPVVFALGPVNPHRSKSTMKKRKASATKRRKRNPAPWHRSKARTAHKVTHHRRRRNPRGVGMVEVVKLTGVAALGLLITRQGPQYVLGSKNAGVVGYLGNTAAILASIYLGSMFGGVKAGFAAGIGGGMYLLSRLLTEMTPLGQVLKLSGVGDAHAAGHLGRLGAVVPGYYPTPVNRTPNAPGYILPGAITDAIRAGQAPAPVAVPNLRGAWAGRAA